MDNRDRLGYEQKGDAKEVLAAYDAPLRRV